MIEEAIQSPAGQLRVIGTREYLISSVVAQKFNRERATEVFAMEVDNLVWIFLRDVPHRRAIYRDYRASRLRDEFSSLLANEFVEQSGVTDQRPARKWLRFLLGA
jgi:hypothetical protein